VACRLVDGVLDDDLREFREIEPDDDAMSLRGHA
jgi:hypothetical protein